MPPPALPPAPKPAPTGRRRLAWAATIALSLLMLGIPVGIATLLSAGGDGNSSAEAADEPVETRSKSDREAGVAFHLRPDGSLGLRILRGAPADTRAVRGRRLGVVCGSVSGLMERTVRWPRGAATVQAQMPPEAHAAAEFCALKRGGASVARVVFD